MSDNSDRAAWQVTIDREQIREWAEEHETVPVLAEETDGTDLRLLSNPPDERGEQLSWDRFFERFETQSLALRYRETPAGGDGQPAYEFVGRDEITGAEVSGREAPDSPEADTHEDDSESQSTPPGTEGTGVTQADSETAARSDEAAKKSEMPTSDEDVANAAGDTAMSASSRGVETDAFVLDEIHEAHGLMDDVEDEYLTFRNRGDEALDLSDWVIENKDGQRFVFPDGFTLDSDQNVTVHSSRGSDTETDVYWGATSGVWDDGDTITVRSADGQEVLREPHME